MELDPFKYVICISKLINLEMSLLYEYTIGLQENNLIFLIVFEIWHL